MVMDYYTDTYQEWVDSPAPVGRLGGICLLETPSPLLNTRTGTWEALRGELGFVYGLRYDTAVDSWALIPSMDADGMGMHPLVVQYLVQSRIVI
jgi:hypothetical protein